MWRVTWRNLFARKLRLLLSAFAIVLGVAFVAGSMIFTNAMGGAFDDIIEGSTADVEVAFNLHGSGPQSHRVLLAGAAFFLAIGICGVLDVALRDAALDHEPYQFFLACPLQVRRADGSPKRLESRH